jgi:hypothetical protein
MMTMMTTIMDTDINTSISMGTSMDINMVNLQNFAVEVGNEGICGFSCKIFFQILKRELLGSP